MEDQNVNDLVNGLLPDQHGTFRNTKSDYLYKDGGIPVDIKDIANALGDDLREQLLHNEMATVLEEPGYDAANELIHELLDDFNGDDYTERQAIEVLLESLEQKLPDDSQFDEVSGLNALRASAQLVSYLAENENVPLIRRCPLLTAAGRVAYLTVNQQILAPSLHWPETSRPYVGLYTQNRLLSDLYIEDREFIRTLELLIATGLAIKSPLFFGRRPELSDVNLLREMAVGDQETSAVTIRQ